jgi:WXG100 family type VII secretion target
MANEVQADYERLQQAAQRFQSQAKTIQDMEKWVKRSFGRVQASWEGKGATAFFQEMNTILLPGITRLHQAFATTAQITGRIAQVMELAETEAAALFRREPVSGMGGGGDGMQPISNPGESGAGETKGFPKDDGGNTPPAQTEQEILIESITTTPWHPLVADNVPSAEALAAMDPAQLAETQERLRLLNIFYVSQLLPKAFTMPPPGYIYAEDMNNAELLAEVSGENQAIRDVSSYENLIGWMINDPSIEAGFYSRFLELTPEDRIDFLSSLSVAMLPTADFNPVSSISEQTMPDFANIPDPIAFSVSNQGSPASPVVQTLLSDIVQQAHTNIETAFTDNYVLSVMSTQYALNVSGGGFSAPGPSNTITEFMTEMITTVGEAAITSDYDSQTNATMEYLLQLSQNSAQP